MRELIPLERKNKIILNDSCCLHFVILHIITQEAALYLCNGKPIDFYLILLTNEDNGFIILLIYVFTPKTTNT